jgi:hypothetical protein
MICPFCKKKLKKVGDQLECNYTKTHSFRYDNRDPFPCWYLKVFDNEKIKQIGRSLAGHYIIDRKITYISEFKVEQSVEYLEKYTKLIAFS